MNGLAHGMVRGEWGYGYGFGIFSWVTTAVTIAIIIFGIWLVAHMATKGKRAENKPETALDILNRRYASGEIDKKEYEEKKKDLS